MATPLSVAKTAPGLRRLLPIATWLAALAFALSPLFFVKVPPLQDYLDHLGRAGVLLNHDPNAAIAQNYRVDWRLVPNLAFDLIVPPLARVMPIEVAGRVFLALAMALPVAGAVALQRALFRRVGWWPLASVLFVYNDLLRYGFVAVLVTIGLALLAFSLWISSERWPLTRRILLFAVIAATLMVLHLFAFGVYGLLVASYEAGRFFAERTRFVRRAASLLQFVPACVIWLLSLKNIAATYTAEGPLWWKLAVWPDAVAFSNPPALLDVLIFALVVLGALCLVLRVLVLAPAMRLPVAVAVVAAILMPQWASGSWGADMRLPVALVFILIGASRFEPGQTRGPLPVLAALWCVFLVLRVVSVTFGWRDMDRQIAEFRAAIARLPAGARLTTIEDAVPLGAKKLPGVPEMLLTRSWDEFWHLDGLAVIDRGAFVTDLFTADTSIEPTARNAGLARNAWNPLAPTEFWARERPPAGDPAKLRRPEDGLVPCCYDWPHVYDFVLWLDFGKPPKDLPPVLAPWAAGSYFHIYRVVRP